jgi:nitrite reductase (NO-forming)
MAPMPFPRSVPVPGGNAIVGEMELSVPQTVKIVDHAITRAFNKGVTAEIEVIGPPKLEVFKA